MAQTVSRAFMAASAHPVANDLATFHHGLTLVSLELADAMRAPQLPDVHRDPCDRFIIATALRLGAPVVTTDPRFSEYGVTVIGHRSN